MGMKTSDAKVIRLEDLPLQDVGSLVRKQVVDEKAYSLTWMVKKREFNDDYSEAREYSIVYVIMNDGGYVIINDQQTQLKKGDTVHVPQGSTYYLSKEVECMGFCQPGFNRTENVAAA